MKKLKNVEKINSKFTETFKLLDEFMAKDKKISKLVVFGPTIKSPSYIELPEAEVYLAVYYDRSQVKGISPTDFSTLNCQLEHEVSGVLTYPMQSPIFKYDARIFEDVKNGIVIYEKPSQ